jgi:hypothetical protein
MAGKLAYSCKCGWIDWTHAAPADAKAVIDAVKAKSGRRSLRGGGFKVSVSISQYLWIFKDTVTTDYFVSDQAANDPQQQLGIAIALYASGQIAFETHQGSNPWGNSSFSEEDLFSDLLGFYMAAKGWEKADIRTKCGTLNIEQSSGVWNDLYGNATEIMAKNREWGKPVLHPESTTVARCCRGDTSMPNDLNDIQRAAEGQGWRGWVYGYITSTIWPVQYGDNPDELWLEVSEPHSFKAVTGVLPHG